MEQIYTIPVNEAFEESRKDKNSGCPFCRLYNKLENDEIELVLGASMMEPDVRKKTNRQGFCQIHYKKMMSEGKKLPLALVMQSHLDEINKMVKKPGIAPGISGGDTAKKIDVMSKDCYICKRIQFNFKNMVETAAMLWDTDEEFRTKCSEQQFFCLPHFAEYISVAKDTMKAKTFGEFYKSVYQKEIDYLQSLTDDVSKLVKKFDYRYADEPWEGEQNSVERAVDLLTGTKSQSVD